MWSKSYSVTVKGVTAAQLWAVWTDVNQWQTWQDDIEYAKITGDFEVGNFFMFKPKGGPNIKIMITEVIPERSFVDLTNFPLARMYDAHELIQREDGVEIKSTISMEGPLAWVWCKLVAENIVKGLAQQTESLVKRVRVVS